MPKWTARWFRLIALTLAVLALSWAMAAGAVEPLCGTDIDGDGQATTDTDGQLLLRHLFGFAGEQLITGAVGSGCTRCSAAAIATRLETDACRVLFDIDGDGLRGALTDGLLLWRLLAGLTGQALTADALGAGAVRTDPESLSGWLSTGILPPGEAPWRVQLVAGNSLQGDRIDVEWLTTNDNDTDPTALRYVLHASPTPAFQPAVGTAKAQVTGAVAGTLTGLTPATLYYVKVAALDTRGNSSWSNELTVLTAAAAPVATGQTRLVLDAGNATNLVATPTSVSYRLPGGASPPAVGTLITTAIGEGFLRRVTRLTRNGDQVTLGTAAADLSDTFQDAQLATGVKLIDLPSQQALAGALAKGTLAATQAGDLRSLQWPGRGLTISQRTLPTAALGTPATAVGSVSCNGSGGQTKTQTDSPLQVTYPVIACVEPGGALSIAITAAIQTGSESRYQITQLFFTELDHPKIRKSRPNFGASWSPPVGDSDTRGQGTLSWRPDDSMVDDQSRPFTARFVALAQEREGQCTGLGGWQCRTRRIDFEVPIYVNWGDFPAPTSRTFSSSGAGLTLSGEARVDFQPAVTVDADLRGSQLRRAVVRLDGPVSFRTEVRLAATATGTYQTTTPLLDKRFVKILWAGQVPIVVTGRLVLEAQFRAQADAALDIRQVLELGYDLTAGLDYRDGQWTVLREAKPWQRYELRGEADTHGVVEVRMVPDLTVKFYDIAGGRLKIEPYLYGEAALQGHFSYQDGSGGTGSDVDYRFTKLEFGGGVDGAFRLGLEAFDVSLIGYPSRDPNDLYRFALIGRTPILGLPTLAPYTEGTLRVGGACAIGLRPRATAVPNPFQALTGGPATLNAFESGSARWDLVLPATGATLTQATPPGNAWFSAARAGRYTLRFSGHSALGSFIRQYEDLQVDYDPATLNCPGAGTPWVTPATGAWTRTPQRLAVASDGAATLYYRMVNTDDGRPPADPGVPGPTANDGSLAGPGADFLLYGTAGKLKRSKLRFVGCTGTTCGPASGVFEYAIDLRGGGAVAVTPVSGTWRTSPQSLAVGSAGADSIRYTMVNTDDATTPADPAAPGAGTYDGVLSGPQASVQLYGSPGQLKRSKLRFAGCSGATCGPASGVFEYAIDLREGDDRGGTKPLNDTGIDWCADGSQNGLACPVDGYPWQDAQDGRDKTHDDDSDGHAGFSFTKLDANGNPLAPSAATWSCVRDNVTGLIWEVKTDDSGLRDKDWTYSWYNPDATTNGGGAGTADGGNNCFNTARCDTQKYVADVNAQGLCGAQDWRLPDPRELLSIVSNDRMYPAIDTTYFPNTVASWVWSASPYADYPNYAWSVYFYGGSVYYSNKNDAGSVRLVRGGQ
jgi:hypothetical protein